MPFHVAETNLIWLKVTVFWQRHHNQKWLTAIWVTFAINIHFCCFPSSWWRILCYLSAHRSNEEQWQWSRIAEQKCCDLYLDLEHYASCRLTFSFTQMHNHKYVKIKRQQNAFSTVQSTDRPLFLLPEYNKGDDLMWVFWWLLSSYMLTEYSQEGCM